MIVSVNSNDDNILWGLNDTERIIQNVRNIIRTKRFEIPFMRGLGVNPDYIDSSINSISSVFENEIRENINAYESRANVINIKINNVHENQDIEIVVKLEV